MNKKEDTAMEAKLKHLEFIQTTINRMANNSFLLKGWAVTIMGGLLALTFKEINVRYVYVSLAVIAFFWLLDSYYLSRERHFIKLYDHARKAKPEEVEFSMSTKGLGKWSDWPCCAFSRTIVLFYGGLVLVQILIIYYL